MTLESVKSLAQEAKELRTQYLDKVNELRREVRAADKARNGEGRNELARAAEPGLARRLVYDTLGAADLLTKAKNLVEDFDPRFDVFQFNGVGPVKLTTNLVDAPGNPAFDRSGFYSGGEEAKKVERAARRLLKHLAEAGITAPEGASDKLADFEDVVLS